MKTRPTAKRTPAKRPVSRLPTRAVRNPSKFLSPRKLMAGVDEVTALAAEEGVAIVLVGGLAMQFYGSDRLTGDLDFAVDGHIRSLPALRTLSFGGVQSTTSKGVPVDFILRDDDFRPLYEAALNASPVVPRFGCRVVPPAYLVAMKMAAGRGKDVLDLKFLLAQEGLVDLATTRVVVRRYLGPYAAKELDRLVDEVAWEKSRGDR